jgi:pimeloyl-ACP methyl ester carboxylesterase
MKILHGRLGMTRLVVLGAALLVLALCWLMVWRAGDGLEIRPFTYEGIPMRTIAPEGAANNPGVIIAHGFSGSQQLMQAYGYVLAHAGYTTLLFDFVGHGANGAPLDSNDRSGGALQADLALAYEALLAETAVDPARVALLGHSMGSGAVMTTGAEQTDRYAAVVAVSPTGAEVSAEAPRNFLLMAGQLEPQFAANAEGLLEDAGGANADFSQGLARSLVIVPSVEHITILFAPFAHDLARNWLDNVFGVQRESGYTDGRMGWYLLQLVAWLVAAVAAAPLLRRPALVGGSVRSPWHWLGLLIAPTGATLLLAGLNWLEDVSSLGGMLVAGAMALWFLFFGAIWLAMGVQVVRPPRRSWLWGGLLFLFLWVAFGALAHLVWLPWLLAPERLLRWLPLALALLPWLLAAGWVQQDAGVGRRVGWWLAQSVVLMVGLGTAVFLVPGLFFLVLILPVLPIVLAIMGVAGGVVNDPWAYGVGNALFLGWLLVSLFPLVG